MSLKAIPLLCMCLYFTATFAQQTIYVDKSGVMRWSDSKKEASFYGVNYTLPFAHAYRQVKDHKAAIDKDVYHFSRLGFNAYRIHIWDVEITDSIGRLQQNEHLDLLDYLISRVQQRGIRVLITCMTNFGNGYPERNEPTGGFSYLYDKCDVHKNPKAIAAQETYIKQLLTHVNPYTGKAYKEDPAIVGFEINNEPCHAGDPLDTKKYIGTMVAAIRSTGNKKPIFYNVSHNREHVSAYYDSDIQGTTYQWYPIGLVAGHTRKGNFLPYVDQYNIPFSNEKGFATKAKAIYEFDPADITYSYMYPAMTRTFRSQGFQWITQFAYDPIDIAAYNTEYQTHYLNLAYTPRKALSMKIAAAVAKEVKRGEQFPAYPADTVFGNFRVSYQEDLSLLNNPQQYFYSNNTTVQPIAPSQLTTIAGYGNSPVVKYEGTGAYFLDKLENGVWRLELMPDAIQVADPFARPAPNKEVVTIAWNKWPMQLQLPDLGTHFIVRNLHSERDTIAEKGAFNITPGVYLLMKEDTRRWSAATEWEHIKLGEFVAPPAQLKQFEVVHTPLAAADSGQNISITADIAGPSFPDSVILQTDHVSFWSDHNPYIRLERRHGYTYQGTIPATMVRSENLKYTITVYSNGNSYTFPQKEAGAPLDWNFTVTQYFETAITDANILDGEMEYYSLSERSFIQAAPYKEQPYAATVQQYTMHVKDDNARFFWRKNINSNQQLQATKFLCLFIPATTLTALNIGFITTDGYTYSQQISLNNDQHIYKIPIAALAQDSTALLPRPYPAFMNQYFIPKTNIDFNIYKIETLNISTSDKVPDNASIDIGAIWLE
ncbi:hypothetical protein BW716_15290 [[Flexibacter] sp. ATCC 35208]|nr:hypothetical protein BW716_15290 [[Flexibacter] sp. ATCC 35208]